MTLKEELLAFYSGLKDRVPGDILETMLGATAELRTSGIQDNALREGSLAPDFVLPGADGSAVRLSELLRNGPALLVFYRGAWCPYCNFELRAYQQVLTQIKAKGASLVAISPQLPHGSLTMQQKNKLEFPVLSDVGSKVARSFGLTFELSPRLQKVYRGFGNDLTKINGSEDWVLPIPATYVIASDFRIAKAHVDVDYTVRMEPQEALDALAKLQH